MLSRVAVSLYVLGARLERTEQIARTLRVHAELSLERVGSQDDRFWPRLLELVGWARAGQANRGQAIELMVAGTTGPSLRRTVAEARTAAQAVRPSLSTDVFEQVNALHWRLFERSSDAELHGYLRGAELGVQLLTGLVDETMSHDEARDFLRLGRFVERAGATTRLVTRKAEELGEVGEDALEWAATLRCCSSFEAYRLRVSGAVTAPGVVGSLLCDRANPRSVGFCIGHALAAVRRIDGPDRHGSAQDRLADVECLVERMDAHSVARAPAAFGTEFARQRTAVEEALRSDYFLPGRLTAQLPGDSLAPQPQQQQQS